MSFTLRLVRNQALRRATLGAVGFKPLPVLARGVSSFTYHSPAKPTNVYQAWVDCIIFKILF